MIDKLFKTPCEFGVKRVFCKTKDDLYYLINKYNGIIDCYSTLYSIPEPRAYNKATIDKIYFDLDSKNAWDNLKKAHNKLLELDIQHCALFTGGGCSLFIFCKPTSSLQYPKAAIRKAQKYYAKELGLSIGKPDIADIDEHIVGDIARITRIPYTFNIKPNRRRYCMVITDTALKYPYEKIKARATDQHIEKLQIWGNKKIDLIKFDELPEISMEYMNLAKEDMIIESKDNYAKLLNKLPYLIKNLLNHTVCGWRARYLTILAIKEAGIPIELCIKICKYYWTPEKFHHSLFDEQQFQYIYSRNDLFFPKWETLLAEGFPITKEDKEFDFYGRR